MSEDKNISYALENGLRRGGKYDTIFFGCYAETNTFDIRCRFDLRHKLNRARLQKAANDALRFYPEFAVRPVVYNGRICYEKNNNPVKIAEDDNTRRYFGSDGPDGTNGYLFLFLVGDKHITFSMYHAQTDAFGMISYIIAVFWNYAKVTFPPMRLLNGTKLFEAYGVRLNDNAFKSMDDVERYDSLVKFATDGKLYDPYEGREHFMMPPEVYNKDEMSCRLVNLVISNADFFKKTLELHTSYGPLLAALAAESINDSYDIGDKVIAVILTADSRRFFKSKTLCNMAYNTPVVLSKADMGMPLENICKKLRVQMLNQLKKAHVNQVTKNNLKVAHDVDALGDIDAVGRYLAGPDGLKTQNERTTIFLTYPGKMDNNPVSKLLISGVTPGMLAMDRAINVYSHRDDLVIQFSLKSDDIAPALALKKTLTKYGFDPRMYDMGKVAQNMLSFDRIRKIDDRVKDEAPAADDAGEKPAEDAAAESPAENASAAE